LSEELIIFTEDNKNGEEYGKFFEEVNIPADNKRDEIIQAEIVHGMNGVSKPYFDRS
jgi:hypothetical protein